MKGEYKYVEEDNVHKERSEACIGLCTTCMHKLTCTFPGTAGNPKLFCEEFQCEVLPCPEVTAGISIVSPEQSEARSDQDLPDQKPDRYMGLCINCANRESCNLPKQNGGIWFCEEYQ